MSLDRMDQNSLDRYITGNYGEDQYKCRCDCGWMGHEDQLIEKTHNGQDFTACPECGGDLYG